MIRLLVVLSIIVASPVIATDWYVDNTAIGVNDGTSWADAWKTFNTDVIWGSGGIIAGDTLYISGGTTSKTYTEQWTVGASGSIGSPITIRPGQDASHNGVVIFDYDSSGDEAGHNGITFSNQNYIIFNGEYSGSRHIKIQNLRDIGNRVVAYALRGYTVSNAAVSYIEVVNCNNAVYLTDGKGWEVSYNSFTGIRGDAAITALSSTATTWDENLFHHNTIELLRNNTEPPGYEASSYSGPDGIQGAQGTAIYNNTIMVTQTTEVYTSTQHPDSIQQKGDYTKVYNNEFINIGDSMFDVDASYADVTPAHIWIYNNIFRIATDMDSVPEVIRLYKNSNTLTDIIIANNIFVDHDFGTGYAVIRIDDDGIAGTTGDITIKNNIFYNSGNGAYKLFAVAVNMSGIDYYIDNNIYYGGDATLVASFLGSDYSKSQWITSIDTGGTDGQPLFTTYSANSDSNDYRLQSIDTVARDQGESLSAFFTADYDGVSRPQGSAWDIGAYEYRYTKGSTMLLQ